jgi:hypothetical protein
MCFRTKGGALAYWRYSTRRHGGLRVSRMASQPAMSTGPRSTVTPGRGQAVSQKSSSCC